MSYKVLSYPNGINIIKGYATFETCEALVAVIKEAKTGGFMTDWAHQEKPNKILRVPKAKGQLVIDQCVKDYTEFCKVTYNFNGVLCREQTNLTEWPVGCGRDPHNDYEFFWTSFTTILYLNDDFDGGELIFTQQNITIKPERGDVVIFPSQSRVLEHEVKPPTDKSRYTLAIWLQSETPYTPPVTSAT